jgi:transcriptional regulator with XRE-family HTH domain
MKVNKLNIGRKIKYIRKNKGFSQKELAQKSGVSQAYISAIENNVKNISLKTLKEICKGLGISVSEILSEDNKYNKIDGIIQDLVKEIKKLTPTLQIKLKEFIEDFNYNYEKKLNSDEVDKKENINDMIDKLRQELQLLFEVENTCETDKDIIRKSKELDEILKKYKKIYSE